MAVVYKITRVDGLAYIGIAKNFKNRLASHRLSDRFSSGILKHEILFEGEYQDCYDREETYITEHDTFHNGLNKTNHGRGYGNWSTLGFKFSTESRAKMSQSKKDNYIPWNAGKKYQLSEEVRARRKGKMCSSKLTKDQVLEIRKLHSDKVKLDIFMENNHKGKNGIPITYDIFFVNQYHKEYGLTTTGMRNIIKRKSWVNV
jgi:hypothetical protein